ncbi:unnamed protein product, partial [Callosobruchus maculatus]
QHSLILKPNKSAVILLDRTLLANLLKLKINKVPISFSDSVKNLGFILDYRLRFCDHIALCIQRGYSALKLLYPHRKYLDYDQKSVNFILSQFSYGVPVYSTCIDVDTELRIQRVQNSCVRYIFGIRKYDRVT